MLGHSTTPVHDWEDKSPQFGYRDSVASQAGRRWRSTRDFFSEGVEAIAVGLEFYDEVGAEMVETFTRFGAQLIDFV
jgi:hypothetical protein